MRCTPSNWRRLTAKLYLIQWSPTERAQSSAGRHHASSCLDSGARARGTQVHRQTHTQLAKRRRGEERRGEERRGEERRGEQRRAEESRGEQSRGEEGERRERELEEAVVLVLKVEVGQGAGDRAAIRLVVSSVFASLCQSARFGYGGAGHEGESGVCFLGVLFFLETCGICVSFAVLFVCLYWRFISQLSGSLCCLLFSPSPLIPLVLFPLVALPLLPSSLFLVERRGLEQSLPVCSAFRVV